MSNHGQRKGRQPKGASKNTKNQGTHEKSVKIHEKEEAMIPEKKKEKKIDHDLRVALIVGCITGILSIIGSVLASGISAHSNVEIAKSNIEAARLSLRAEKNTDGDIGTLNYKERSIYRVVKNNVAIRPFPYDDKRITTCDKDELFTIEASITNNKENVWFRLASDVHSYPESDSNQAYIYSENLEFVEDAAIIEWKWGEQNINGRQFTAGSQLLLEGYICSSNIITQITAELISPNDPKIGKIVEINDLNAYSFSIDSSPLGDFPFESLPIGNDYQLTISIDYLTGGGETQLTKRITNSFDIVDTDRVPAYETADITSCLFQGDGQQHEVLRHPYFEQHDKNVLSNYTVEVFHISEVVKNEYGEIWYKLDPEKSAYDHDAYIFSGDVIIVNP